MNKRVLILLAATLGCSGAASVIVNSGERVMENREENNRDGFNEQSLFNAVMDGNIEEVRKNLFGGNVDPNIETEDGTLLIVQAIKLGKETIAQELAENTKIMKKYSEDKDPFIQAAVKGYADLAILLLDKYESPKEYFYKESSNGATFERSLLYFVLKRDLTNRNDLLRKLAEKSMISSIISIKTNSDLESIVYTTRYMKLIDELGIIYSDISSDKSSASDKLQINNSKLKEKIGHAIAVAKKFDKLTSAKYPSNFTEGKPLIFFLMLIKDESKIKMLASQIYRKEDHKKLHNQILRELENIYPSIYDYWKNRDLDDIYYLEASNVDDKGYALTNGVKASTDAPEVTREDIKRMKRISRSQSMSGQTPNIIVSDARSTNTSPDDKKGGVRSKIKKLLGIGKKSKEAEDVRSIQPHLKKLADKQDKNNVSIHDVDIIDGRATYIAGDKLYSDTTNALEEESTSREGSRNGSTATSPVIIRKTGSPKSNTTIKDFVSPFTLQENGSVVQKRQTIIFIDKINVNEMVDVNQLLDFTVDKINSAAVNDIVKLEALSRRLVDLMVKKQISIQSVKEYLETEVYGDTKNDILTKLISKANVLSMHNVDYDGDKNKCKELATQLRKLIKQFK